MHARGSSNSRANESISSNRSEYEFQDRAANAASSATPGDYIAIRNMDDYSDASDKLLMSHTAPLSVRKNTQCRRTLFYVLPLVVLIAWLGTIQPPNTLPGVRQGHAPRDSIFIRGPANPSLSPYEKHPIRTLMEDAQRNWDAKVAKQSKTLQEAIAEYRRRYGREPPPGFDIWYKWSVDHKVQLIDEFDTIMDHITPYHSLTPLEMAERVKHLENAEHPNHAILRIRKGKALPWTGADWRTPITDDWTIYVTEFMPHLPDMDVAIHLHDGPALMLDADAKEAYLSAAMKGQHVDEKSLNIDGRAAWDGRARTCKENSRYRRYLKGMANEISFGGPAFVHDHVAEMDYCTNPQVAALHGSTSSQFWLTPLHASWSMSRTPRNADILFPSTIQYDLNPKDESSFKQKKAHKIVWRGSPDGIYVAHHTTWRSSQRFRLLYLATSNDTSSTRPLRLTKTDKLGHEYQIDVDVTLDELNKRYSNIRPTNQAVQCDPDLCEHINGVFEFVPRLSLEEMAEHRYVMDVDGNAYSARFRTHLLSNQIPFKSTRYPEWYSDRIQPWLHYIPVSQDYSDLYNILAFFDGGLGPNREGHHDDLAELIAMKGKEWAQTHWRFEDMQSYFFRALLEYGRLFQRERVAPVNPAHPPRE